MNGDGRPQGSSSPQPHPARPYDTTMPVLLVYSKVFLSDILFPSTGPIFALHLRSTHNSPHCHPERSEGSLAGAGQVLRSAQDDSHTKGNASGVRPHL